MQVLLSKDNPFPDDLIDICVHMLAIKQRDDTLVHMVSVACQQLVRDAQQLGCVARASSSNDESSSSSSILITSSAAAAIKDARQLQLNLGYQLIDYLFDAQRALVLDAPSPKACAVLRSNAPLRDKYVMSHMALWHEQAKRHKQELHKRWYYFFTAAWLSSEKLSVLLPSIRAMVAETFRCLMDCYSISSPCTPTKILWLEDDTEALCHVMVSIISCHVMVFT